MCVDPIGLEGLVWLVSSIPSGSYILFASSNEGFPKTLGRGVDGFDVDIPF